MTTANDASPTPGAAGTAMSMRAVTQDRYGDAGVLRVTSISRPGLDPKEVLVEVHAAAVDRGTEHLMTGLPYMIRLFGFGLRRPKNPVLGLDVAGTVAAVGAEVSRFAVGDQVFGIARGSCAEFAAADEAKLALKPANVSFEHAAASTVSGCSALEALTDVGRLKAGQRVLVVGASGGVGTFAVQLAKALGATVDGIAGSDNLELVEALGANKVFDYRTTDLADIEESYDLVIDIGGHNQIRSLRRVLTATGTLVIVGGTAGNRLTGGFGRTIRAAAMSPFVAHRLVMFSSTEHFSFIERLGAYLESGEVVPAVGDRFALHEVSDAMQRMASGQLSGKAVIVTGMKAQESKAPSEF